MPDGKRIPGPVGMNDLQLRLTGPFASAGVRTLTPFGRFSFGLPSLRLDPELHKVLLRDTLTKTELMPLWDVLLEHGRPVLTLPFEPPTSVPKGRNRWLTRGDPASHPQMIFEIPPLDEALIKTSKSLGKFASLLGLDTLSLSGSRLWVVFENDIAGLGSGSDQGSTAFLGLYLTFDTKNTGLTRLGWTVIDMRTPRPTLPAGAPFDSSSRYETPAGPYSGISSIDFTVTLLRTSRLKVDILGAVGVNSTRWGKFVQDVIHEKVSNSPLFPWPNNPTKFFAEGGVAALITPQTALTEGDVFGIAYAGRIELGGKLMAGTHRTEATADAKFVIRTASVKTRLGDLRAEYSPLGVFGRGFLRYSDGREAGFKGVEGGFTSSAMVKIGRLGIGLSGEILVSTDPALRTGNPAGSRPGLSPLSEIPGSSERLGGPAGHHGKGQFLLTWTF